MAKHFFKTLTIFLAMIILGLVGIYAAGYLDKGGERVSVFNNKTEVAK